MKTENAIPLYKTLNEQRTQGEWMLAENHLPKNHYTQSVLSLGSTLVADFIRHNFKKVGQDKFKNRKTLHPCQESLANAQYTALAVNNLASLAEALEALIKDIERKPNSSRYITRVNKAKEALKLIS